LLKWHLSNAFLYLEWPEGKRQCHDEWFPMVSWMYWAITALKDVKSRNLFRRGLTVFGFMNVLRLGLESNTTIHNHNVMARIRKDTGHSSHILYWIFPSFRG
jgi:hypothetical protein